MKTSEQYSIGSVKRFLKSVSCLIWDIKNDDTGLYHQTANNIRIILDYCSELENALSEHGPTQPGKEDSFEKIKNIL